MVVVAGFAELVAKVVGCGIFFVELEGRAVHGMAVESTSFAGHRFDDLGDRHTFLRQHKST